MRNSTPACLRHVLCAALLSVGLGGAVHAQAPVVMSVSPARNALTAPRTTPIVVRFSQPLSNTAATQSALKVFSQQTGGQKTGMATVSGNTLSFDPTIDFKAGETVSATVTTAVQSSSGQPLAQGQVLQFTTATSPSTGTFSSSPQDLTTNAPTRSVVLGDVDGDGDNDLLTANNSFSSGSTVSVRLNNGSGVFGAVVQEVSTGPAIFDIALADFDADGDLDLVTASYNSVAVNVRLNNGTGVLASTGSDVPVSVFPSALTTGDVDNDGNLDILVSTLAGNVNVLPGNGSGIFTVSRPVGGVGGVIGGSCVALGDVDNDGDLDLLVTYNTSITGGATELNVRLNNGQGGFSTTGQQLPLGSASYKVALGDVDGDGDLDVVASTGLYRNEGNGTFAGTPQLGIGETVLGDVDGDGDLDWLLASGQAVTVRRNTGNGTFTSSQQVSVGGTLDLALSDLDNNSTLDLVTVGDTIASIRFNQPVSGPLPTATRLNAGGGALNNTTQGTFESDQYYSSSSNVFTNFVPIAGTLDDALYQSERFSTQGRLHYAVPVVNGLYTVVLHFAELYWTQPGQRVFNIGLEGTTVRTNYDIVAKVGPLTATTETHQVRVTDGILNLDLVVPYLSGGRDQAKLSALEVLPALPTYRLNVGGPNLTTTSGEFTANNEFYTGSDLLTITSPIASTLDDALYQSERYSLQGQLSYALAVPNNTYTVVLHFAEIYWTRPGQRVFNIALEGTTVRTNYDIVAKVGPLAATTETFTVTVTDGLLNLDLVVPYGTGGADQAKLSALEILSASASTRPLATSSKQTAPSALQVYPNPTPDGHFTLSYLATKAQAGTLTLIDPLGRTVHQQQVQMQTGSNQVSVPPALLRAGLYQLVLRTADGQHFTHKVLLQP